MKGRSRSAGPEVPSWAVPPARCSWADPAPGGGKPGGVRALPLSSLGQSRSARPFPAGAGVLFRPVSLARVPETRHFPPSPLPQDAKRCPFCFQARWGSPRTHVLDRSARIERCVFPLWLLLLPETAAC